MRPSWLLLDENSFLSTKEQDAPTTKTNQNKNGYTARNNIKKHF
ncbi:MAG: hypothetical protein SWZ49_27235 [Cyanobacteriota bacterium]|nr:hypothetical protein [Cyanobacteriota bacterium]